MKNIRERIESGKNIIIDGEEFIVAKCKCEVGKTDISSISYTTELKHKSIENLTIENHFIIQDNTGNKIFDTPEKLLNQLDEIDLVVDIDLIIKCVYSINENKKCLKNNMRPNTKITNCSSVLLQIRNGQLKVACLTSTEENVEDLK